MMRRTTKRSNPLLILCFKTDLDSHDIDL